MNKILG